ncbi:MAG: glycosyltransferase family 87 protein [Myxococcaceae bacterium]
MLLLVGYCVFRAQYLSACDLVHGFLEPTRGVILQGLDPLTAYPFNSYTLFFYTVMTPLALLPNAAASLIWTLLSLVFVVGISALLARILKRCDENAPRVPAWLPPLLALPFLLDNLFLGQSNLFSLFFTCAALWSLLSERPWRAGFLLSVAIAFKITPGLFLFFFLLKRQWRALAGALIGVVFCLLVAPSVVVGPARSARELRSWGIAVLRPFVEGQKVRTTNISWYHTNQSLDAFLNRFLTPYGAEKYCGLHAQLDLGRLSEDEARKIGIALKLILLALLTWVVLSTRAFPLQIGLFFLATLFLSPASWFNHYALALIAYGAAAQILIRQKGTQFLKVALGAAVLASAVAVTPQARSYSPILLTQLAFFAALMFAIKRSSKEGQPLLAPEDNSIWPFHRLGPSGRGRALRQ